MTALVTQAGLERRIGGPRYLVQLTDDNGDGVADADTVAQILDEASRIGEALLWDGWPNNDQIAALVAADVALQGAIYDIACGLAGDRRPEWRAADGEPFYSTRRTRGEAYLREVAMAKGRRSRAEGAVGANAIVGPRTTAQNPPVFTFAASSSNTKGPGGF